MIWWMGSGSNLRHCFTSLIRDTVHLIRHDLMIVQFWRAHLKFRNFLFIIIIFLIINFANRLHWMSGVKLDPPLADLF